MEQILEIIEFHVKVLFTNANIWLYSDTANKMGDYSKQGTKVNWWNQKTSNTFQVNALTKILYLSFLKNKTVIQITFVGIIFRLLVEYFCEKN